MLGFGEMQDQDTALVAAAVRLGQKWYCHGCTWCTCTGAIGALGYCSVYDFP